MSEMDAKIAKTARFAQVYSNNMAGTIAAATATTMQNAASNEGGAMMGFMGMYMAQAQGGNVLNTAMGERSSSLPSSSRNSSYTLTWPSICCWRSHSRCTCSSSNT